MAALLFVCVTLVRSGRYANLMEFSFVIRNPSTESAISVES